MPENQFKVSPEAIDSQIGFVQQAESDWATNPDMLALEQYASASGSGKGQTGQYDKLLATDSDAGMALQQSFTASMQAVNDSVRSFFKEQLPRWVDSLQNFDKQVSETEQSNVSQANQVQTGPGF